MDNCCPFRMQAVSSCTVASIAVIVWTHQAMCIWVQGFRRKEIFRTHSATSLREIINVVAAQGFNDAVSLAKFFIWVGRWRRRWRWRHGQTSCCLYVRKDIFALWCCRRRSQRAESSLDAQLRKERTTYQKQRGMNATNKRADS